MAKAKLYNWLLILCLLLSNSCQKKLDSPKKAPYDIILLMGQSNTLGGAGLDDLIDHPVTGVNQLGRFELYNYTVIPAAEPLQNSTPEKGHVGFALTFAKLYADRKLEKGREVLIIPCGANSSGFLSNRWNRGNDLYTDAVERTNFVLQHFPGSKLKCFLWHQGESDVNFGASDYQVTLEQMIYGLCHDIKTKSVDSIPFIMGGLVPYWIDIHEGFRHIDSTLRIEPGRLPVAGFADPQKPFVIKKPVDSIDAIHYDANGQREMGKRYFAEYLRLAK